MKTVRIWLVDDTAVREYENVQSTYWTEDNSLFSILLGKDNENIKVTIPRERIRMISEITKGN